MKTMPDKFHTLAKDAGNKLRAYVLSISTGGTAIYFFSLTNKNVSDYSFFQKVLLCSALISFLCTTGFCLVELRIDAKRFFIIAKELEKEEKDQDWLNNNRHKALRLKLIFASYFSLGFSLVCSLIFLITKII